MDAEGEVEEFLDRTSVFGASDRCDRASWCAASRGKWSKRALDMAMKYSTINQSFKSKIVIEPDIIIQPAKTKES